MDAFSCPITYEMFVDPVAAAHNHTYERKAIEQWFKNHQTSPLTGLGLPHKKVVSQCHIKKSDR